MKNHYIPQLLLRQFAENGKVNSFKVHEGIFETRKIQKAFFEEGLFPDELEEKFARKLEGPFGDLLNHKLLADTDEITINRQENLLIRKFEMIHRMRSPLTNMSHDDLMKLTQEENNPSYILTKYILGMSDFIPSDKTYMKDLIAAMEYDSIEEILDHEDELSPSLVMSARLAFSSYFEIWDASDSGQEFISSTLTGINLQDQYGFMHKSAVMMEFYEENCRKLSEVQNMKFWEILNGMREGNIDNYWICPLSPTRALIGVSPFFKAFFPQPRCGIYAPYVPSLLREKDFNKHFYEPVRKELFEPCRNYLNQTYTYKVHKLNEREVHFQNALVLNEEPEEFLFHDYDKIRDSFWAYENVFTMVKKKHDYSRWL